MKNLDSAKIWGGFGMAIFFANFALSQALPASVPITASAPAPKIAFEAPIFDFGKVKMGDLVKHTFYFTNIGSGILNLSNVQPSCGCTAAGDWTRQVEPGKTGIIPVQFNSANFNGQVHKTVTVTSSDPIQPAVMLQINGTIWRPIDINPQFAILNIPSDGPANSSIVRVINNTDEPLTVFPPESNNPKLTATLHTNIPGKEYQFVISAVPPLTSGNFQGQITAKTSSTNMPLLTVTAWANVQPAVMVMPPQIVLPPAPLGGDTTPTITIQNNSSSLIQVSDLSISISNITPQLHQTVPGKTFSISVPFPKGFELPAHIPAELTLKTTHPQAPSIRIPITQIPRATPVGIPAPARVAPAASSPKTNSIPVPTPPLPH
ncbi:MAG: DUF1573 domain-containing protein [Verrucomicrobiota bacterium]